MGSDKIKNGAGFSRTIFYLTLFVGKELPDNEIVERSRRCAYVGLSRPRHLLCVAMKAKTYEGHERAFAKDWKVIHVR